MALSSTSANAFFSGLVIIGAAACATPAAAQATRTWVSGVGDDVNPCSRTAPCKTFAGAISKTAAGGEIDCLDPGGFGTLTITKSITIDCTGTFGSTLNSGGINGFVINDSATAAPGTTDVILRGLSIDGAGTTPGLNGVRFISGRSLVLKDVFIQNQKSGSGISFAPNTTARLTVIDTAITYGLNGIDIGPTGSGSARVALTNVRIVSNTGDGIRWSSAGASNPFGAQGTIDNVEVSANGQGIIISSSGAASNAIAMITNSNISNNTTFGIRSNGAAARARVGSSTITVNGTGVNAISGGDVVSYGTNRLNGNTVDGLFNSTTGQQ
jgi:hypothetical protein